MSWLDEDENPREDDDELFDWSYTEEEAEPQEPILSIDPGVEDDVTDEDFDPSLEEDEPLGRVGPDE
jgi:hypothetical protein